MIWDLLNIEQTVNWKDIQQAYFEQWLHTLGTHYYEDLPELYAAYIKASKTALKLDTSTKKEKFQLSSQVNDATKEAIEQLQTLFQQNQRLDLLTTWKKFFLSPTFLAVQYDDEWIEVLAQFLQHYQKQQLLPMPFLVVFSMSYGLFADTMPILSHAFFTYDPHKEKSPVTLYSLLKVIAFESLERQIDLLKQLHKKENLSTWITFTNYRSLRLAHEAPAIRMTLPFYEFVPYYEREYLWQEAIYPLTYQVYPIIKVPREPETIDLLVYFIQHYQQMPLDFYIMLVEIFSLQQLKDAQYQPIKDALESIHLNIAKLDILGKTAQKEKKALLNQYAAFCQDEAGEAQLPQIQAYFASEPFQKYMLTSAFLLDFVYLVETHPQISYSLWKELFLTYQTSYQKEQEQRLNDWSFFLETLREGAFEKYWFMFKNKKRFDEHSYEHFIETEQTRTEADRKAKEVPEEKQKEWLLQYIYLDAFSRKGIRTIYREHLFEQIQQFGQQKTYQYDMESDGKIIIYYQLEQVVLYFSLVKEKVTLSHEAYASLLEEMVTLYQETFFCMAKEKLLFQEALACIRKNSK
ncbi:hypothetical protein [Isobaculum melis]|uniref:Uncharacterized protein n=1 Tax=Isobaculum melis TaxID=142588 RepID=A0A1H9TG61_9LACT|nr:hypothetical protein [Isobaculum melis]SER96131.1 hypothetical protein SAMN04488559_11337 [Isobaculum melis]